MQRSGLRHSLLHETSCDASHRLECGGAHVASVHITIIARALLYFCVPIVCFTCCRAGIYVDLRPHMNQAPVAVRDVSSGEHVCNVFVALSLRHMIVIDEVNYVQGIITRHDLHHAAGKLPSPAMYAASSSCIFTTVKVSGLAWHSQLGALACCTLLPKKAFHNMVSIVTQQLLCYRELSPMQVGYDCRLAAAQQVLVGHPSMCSPQLVASFTLGKNCLKRGSAQCAWLAVCRSLQPRAHRLQPSSAVCSP